MKLQLCCKTQDIMFYTLHSQNIVTVGSLIAVGSVGGRGKGRSMWVVDAIVHQPSSVDCA